MERIKKVTDWVFKHSPGYENELDQARTKTSKMLWARRRVAFTRVFAPGNHLEAESYIMDRRLKTGIFRHFRYLGPRGEFIVYFAVVLLARRVYLNNIYREHNIESVLNDRDVFLKVDLPVELRKFK